jgi:hypothetical protein
MIVVRGIGFGGVGGGFNEVFGREGKREGCDCAENDGSTAKAQFHHWLHGSDYRGMVGSAGKFGRRPKIFNHEGRDGARRF